MTSWHLNRFRPCSRMHKVVGVDTREIVYGGGNVQLHYPANAIGWKMNFNTAENLHRASGLLWRIKVLDTPVIF